MPDVSVDQESMGLDLNPPDFSPKEMDVNKRVVFRQNLCRTWPETVMCLGTVRNSSRGFFHLL